MRVPGAGAQVQLIYAATHLAARPRSVKGQKVLRSHSVCTWKLCALKGLAAGMFYSILV